jgi:hypothetical protein
MTDEDYWLARLETLRRGGQLELVRKSASVWSGLFASLLGVSSLVVLSGAIQDIATVRSEYALVLRAASTLALGGLAVSTFLAARAGGHVALGRSNNASWQALRTWTVSAVDAATRDLRWAKRIGVATIAVVMVSTLLAIWAPAETSQQLWLAESDDGLICGSLERSDGRVLVAGSEITSVGSLLETARCP